MQIQIYEFKTKQLGDKHSTADFQQCKQRAPFIFSRLWSEPPAEFPVICHIFGKLTPHSPSNEQQWFCRGLLFDFRWKLCSITQLTLIPIPSDSPSSIAREVANNEISRLLHSFEVHSRCSLERYYLKKQNLRTILYLYLPHFTYTQRNLNKSTLPFFCFTKAI